MPDESCRNCGGTLDPCSLCQECRKTTQRICTDCGLKTEEQFHASCLHIDPIQTANGMRMNVVTQNRVNPIKTIKNMLMIKFPLKNTLLVFSIVGFFVLGLSAGGYLEMFESNLDKAGIVNSVRGDTQIPHNDVPDLILYENCIGQGSTQSITVKCPDGKGSVYNAILALPYDLDKKFSKDTFSIRGISLGKNSDGSLKLKYQNDWYPTSFYMQ